MKRKLIGCVATIGLCMSLVGCGNAIPEMTEEQRIAISEYAIEKVLEYDISQESRLVDLSKYPIPTPTPGVEATPEPEGMDEVEDTPVIEIGQESQVTLPQAMELMEGLTLEYVGYDVVESYPAEETDDFLKVSAGMGKKLLVLRFQLMNVSSQALDVEMIDATSSYLITVNDTFSKTASMTLTLEDDLMTYVGTLQPDEGKSLVLLAEYKQEELTDVATITMAVKKGEKSSKLQLQ